MRTKGGIVREITGLLSEDPEMWFSILGIAHRLPLSTHQVEVAVESLRKEGKLTTTRMEGGPEIFRLRRSVA